MPVGNDIVDLRDPETGTGATHPRFDSRVFTDEERAEIEAAPLPVRLRWSLWAAKESAYKVARQLGGEVDVAFHPRRFATRFLDVDRVEVFHRAAGRFDVWLDEATDWIHAVAAPLGSLREKPASVVELLDEAQRAVAVGPGRAVRELARRAVAPLLSLDPTDLRIVMEGGIPRLRWGSRKVPVALSLSHHGRLVACSWDGER